MLVYFVYNIGGDFMCNFVKALGIVLFFMGVGIILGILIPCNTFLLGLILTVAGLVILLN